MQSTRKSRGYGVAVSALSVVLVLSIAVYAPVESAAQEAGINCPDSFVLSSDGTMCSRLAQRTFTSTATCAKGTPSPDGTQCWVPATVVERTDVEDVAAIVSSSTRYRCPAGTTGTPVEGGTCTRTETTTTTEPVIVVAPATVYECPAGTTGAPVEGGTCDAPGVPIITTETPVCSTTQTTLPSGQCSSDEPFAGATAPAGSTCPSGTVADDRVAANDDGSIKCFVATSPTTCPSAAAGYTYNGTTCSLSTPTTETAPVVSVQPENIFVCPPGSTGTPVEGGTCTEQVTVIDDETNPTPTVTGYQCPAGSTGTPVEGGTCTQPGPPAVEVPVEEVITWSCPDGYSGPPTPDAICTRETTIDVQVPVIELTPQPTYECPAGYDGTPVEGGTCSRDGEPAISTETPTCAPNQASLSPSGLCTDPANFEPVSPTSCPNGDVGFTYNGTTCERRTPTTVAVPVIAVVPATTYQCPPGTAGTPVEGGTCSRSETTTTAEPVIVKTPTPVYECPAGTTGTPVEGGTCVASTIETIDVPVIAVRTQSVYRCPQGYVGVGVRSDLVCRRTITTPIATCAAGTIVQKHSTRPMCAIGKPVVAAVGSPFCSMGTLSSDRATCVLGITATRYQHTPVFAG